MRSDDWAVDRIWWGAGRKDTAYRSNVISIEIKYKVWGVEYDHAVYDVWCMTLWHLNKMANENEHDVNCIRTCSFLTVDRLSVKKKLNIKNLTLYNLVQCVG